MIPPAGLNVDLLGTSFAITKKHVITAYHNLLGQEDDENSMLGSSSEHIFHICRNVKKISSDHCFQDPIAVKYVLGSFSDDWAILEIVESPRYFDEFIPLCASSDLPNPSLFERLELKTYHAPIGQFMTNGFETGQIWWEQYQPVLQYDRDGKWICVQGGLYRGSCGAPYVDRNGRVVAMHLASMHEGREYSHMNKKQKRPTVATLSAAVDAITEYSTDMSDVHNSVRQGLVLATMHEVVDFVARHT